MPFTFGFQILQKFQIFHQYILVLNFHQIRVTKDKPHYTGFSLRQSPLEISWSKTPTAITGSNVKMTS